MDTSEIGKRMKEYENVNNIRLIDKLPVVLRLDGVSFHSFTRGMQRPFDRILNEVMQLTMLQLCKEIPGCVIGYTQSDEITLVLADYENPFAQPWRGYVKRKLESITASMATRAFNHIYCEVINKYATSISAEKLEMYCKKLDSAIFDCRAFNLPVHEVENSLIWRQCVCVRNSILSVGYAHFSQKQLHGKNCNQIQEMLFAEKNINWNDFPTYLKRGTCAIKKPVEIKCKDSDRTIFRDKWMLDFEIPVFTKDRNYIRSRIKC